MTRTKFENTVWKILGEGETQGRFFGGSTAEAVDDALRVGWAVLNHNVTTFAEFDAWDNS